MYCGYERKDFPDEQFVMDPDWGSVHSITPRHTVTGSLIDAGSGTGGVAYPSAPTYAYPDAAEE